MLHVEVFSKNNAIKKFENLQENDKSKFYDCKINLTFFLVFFESAILKKRVEKSPLNVFMLELDLDAKDGASILKLDSFGEIDKHAFIEGVIDGRWVSEIS